MTQLSDPPKGWNAMLERLATEDSAPQSDAPAKRGGFLSRLFMGPVGRARVRGESDIARLGLSTTEHAEERYSSTSRVPGMVGPTVMKGRRHGRAVELRIDSDRYRAKVEVAVPEFHVRSESGQLRASERSPSVVHEALAGLSRDERWEGVEVKGGPDGITVLHKHDTGRGGNQGYLDDLWLAEGLAELLGEPPGAAPGGAPGAP